MFPMDRVCMLSLCEVFVGLCAFISCIAHLKRFKTQLITALHVFSLIHCALKQGSCFMKIKGYQQISMREY